MDFVDRRFREGERVGHFRSKCWIFFGMAILCRFLLLHPEQNLNILAQADRKHESELREGKKEPRELTLPEGQ